MTFSAPSALAAATRPFIPPQSDAEVAVLALLHPAVLLGELPQAATSKNATTARPSWRTGLLHFMLPSPFETTDWRQAGDQYAGEILLRTRLRCKDGERCSR